MPSSSNAKRKAQDVEDDGSNPLLAKYAKKQKKSADTSNKRKAGTSTDEQNGPSTSQSQSHPTKKFKPDSSSRAPLSKQSSQLQFTLSQEDPVVERDVRAMEDEADILRRKSRLQTMDPALRANAPGISFTSANSSPSRSTVTKPSKSKKKDNLQSIEEEETSQIERSRAMRSADSSVRTPERRSEPSESSSTGKGRHARSSSGGRGKRISDAFEIPGLIVQPHEAVSESSFYRHISTDLPESDRLRQLLTWCLSRAASFPSTSSNSPPLSTKAAKAFETFQQDMIRMVADRTIDIESKTSTPSEKKRSLKPNPQNESNIAWEVVYGEDIARAEAEAELWKETSKLWASRIAAQRAALAEDTAERASEGSTMQSEKARGKRRATEEPEDDAMNGSFGRDPSPDVRYLSQELREGVELAKKVLANSRAGKSRQKDLPPRSASSTSSDVNSIAERMKTLEFKIDKLRTYANTAHKTTRVAERLLDQRYALLGAVLKARASIYPPHLHLATSEAAQGDQQAAQLLSTYLPSQSITPAPSEPTPLDIMRALTRVDVLRPPNKVGDAARKAAREVQRAEQDSEGSNPRRMTGVFTETPGTPKRPTTPSKRGTTPKRDG